MIVFNKPPFSKNGFAYMKDAISNNHISGDGIYTKKVSAWLEENFSTEKALLTTSCTHAIEMAAILADIQSGDEVIMSSFTFVSTANPFVLRGATIKFVDIDPKTMNIDADLIEAAITDKTKAIVPMHYGGVGCNMEKIMELASKYNLLVIEDAAQCMMAKYDGQFLGTFGDLGTFSYHETKNYTMGEGGALFVNDRSFIERAEIIREKGTNRSQFFRGQIDKYTWTDIGSSYLPSEINAAYLYGQLEEAKEINEIRLNIWQIYHNELATLVDKGSIECPFIPENCDHNAHLYYIKTKDLVTRQKLISYLKDHGVHTVFHYVPLHSSPAGQSFGEFVGEDKYTTRESERLLRLPMHMSLTTDEANYVAGQIIKFYEEELDG